MVFDRLALVDVDQDIVRNVVSLRVAQDLFDDLSQNPNDWVVADRVEQDVKPPSYRSATPVIDRPFEDAQWFGAITWPFKNWRSSRYSDGSYGVWYGSESVETTVYETAYHWQIGLLRDAGFERTGVVAERKVYKVACAAALLDLRKLVGSEPNLLHPTDYALCQSVGARVNREGHPGLLTPSVRRPNGENVAIFNSNVLSNPRHDCHLTYWLEDNRIVVEKDPGRSWITIPLGSKER